jgi:hypothetical protein
VRPGWRQAVAFPTDVAGADPLGARSDTGSQADVVGDLLRVGKAADTDVTKLEDEHDGEEGADAGDRTQPAHARISPPLLSKFAVEATDLAVQDAQQRPGVLADAARDRGQRQALELPVPGRGEPALARGRLQIVAGEQGDHPIPDLATDPGELDAVAKELAGLAQDSRRNPDRRQEIAAQQVHQAVGIHTIILEPGARDRLVCFGCERTG